MNVPLAAIGTLIEVTPWDTIQHRPDEYTEWSFIDDSTPFRFRVAGELTDDGFFYGLQGPVESGPARYLNLICNIMLRHDNSDWQNTTECGANFKVAPSAAKRVAEYDPKEHNNVPFFLHPEGTSIDGYPRTSRFGGIQVVSEPSETENG